jgi:CRP-like cAMP-binding protein
VTAAVLDALGEEERRELLRHARRRTFARQEVVFHRDDPADTLHVIVRGRFAVSIATPMGDDVVLNVLGPGDLFGELGLLGPEPRRSASVVALEPGETRAIRRDDFEALSRAQPDVWRLLTTALAERVRRLSELLAEAIHLPAEQRVLRRVHELAAIYAGTDGAPPAIPLTQDALAGLAGTSRATVNRVLRDAERRGEVELRRGRTVLRDPDALARRARIGTGWR